MPARDALPSLDLNLLVLFDAVLRHRSVTTAARSLGLSQSALSHGLGRLRAALGDPLFILVDRRMVPTTLAERMAPRMTRALDELRAALAPDAFDPSLCTDRFSLSAPDVVLARGLPHLLERWRQTAPKVGIELSPLDPAAATAGLLDGALDLAILPLHVRPRHLHVLDLFREPYVTIARKGHPGIAGRLSLSRFLELEHVIVGTHEPRPSDIDQWLQARQLTRKVALRSPSFGIVPGLVAQSDLIATTIPTVVYASGWAPQLQLLTPPLDVVPSPACMVWHERAHTDPRQHWFRSEIQSAFASVPGPSRAGRRRAAPAKR